MYGVQSPGFVLSRFVTSISQLSTDVGDDPFSRISGLSV
jgi:hypothetical protein